MTRGQTDPITLASNGIELRPMVPSDVGELYRLASSASGAEWRLRGRAVSFDEFTSMLWGGVLYQFVVVRAGEVMRPYGLVSAFGPGPNFDTASLSVLLAQSAPGHVSSAVGDVLVLFLDYVFEVGGLRKLLIETSESSLLQPLTSGRFPVRHEGTRVAQLWRGGQLIDVELFAVFADEWRAWTPPSVSASMAPRVPPFGDFVACVRSHLDLPDEVQLTGGMTLGDLDLDSLALVELLLAIEDRFGALRDLQSDRPLANLQDLYEYCTEGWISTSSASPSARLGEH